MNIDGKNLRLGRLGTVVAKKALLGETINIVNAAEVVITGDKKKVFASFIRKKEMGTPSTGPFHSRVPSQVVKRSIRGMLPYKMPRGRAALERVKCYNGVPPELANEKFESITEAHIDESMASKYVSVGRICKLLGGKE